MNEQTVVVSSAQSPNCFYVLLEDFVKHERKFQEIIQLEALREIPPSLINLQDIYFAISDDQWYRVRVTKVLLQKNRVEVFFIDYGQSREIRNTQLKTCNMNRKGQAVKCSLLTKLNSTTHGTWKSDMTTLFKFLVSKRKLLRMTTVNEVDGTHYVDLVTLERFQNYSIADFLMSVNNMQITPSVPIKPKLIKNIEIIGTNVTIRHVASPSELYVADNEYEQDEAVMKIELTEFYHQNPANFCLLAPGVACATEDKLGQWHRVEVLKWPDSEGLCEFKFIDTGKIGFAHWHNLYELDEQFYDFPCFALKSSLSDIKPIGESWTIESTNFIRSHLEGCREKIEMTKAADGVKIRVEFESLKIDINQSLVFFKLALSTDEIVKLMIPYEHMEDNFDDALISEVSHHVKIIDKKNFNPLSFRVTFCEYKDAMELIVKKIQELDKEDVLSWKAGDRCLVFCSVDGDKSKAQWERGLILRITSKTFVFLCDHRFEIEARLSELKKYPDEFKGLKLSSTMVRLACTFTKSWTKIEEKWLRASISAFDSFFILFKDNNNIQFSSNLTPRPVVLWGQDASGDKQDIISELEKRELVKPMFNEKRSFKPAVELWSLLDHVKDDAKTAQRKLSTGSTLDGSIVDVGDYKVALKKKLHVTWLPAVPITQPSFVAKVTHVDQDGFVNVYHIEEHELLKAVNERVNQHFRGIAMTNYPFIVGDACLVKFENDALYYRGRIIEMFNDDECCVLFIDYGNIQRGEKKRLFEHVICDEVPTIAQRFRLEDPPFLADGTLDQNVLDKLHALIVDEKVTVGVHKDDVDNTEPNFVKRCVIRLGSRVIKSYHDIEKLWKLSHSDSD